MASTRFVSMAGAPVTRTGTNSCLLNLATQTIYNVCRPTKLVMKMVSSVFDTTPYDNTGETGMVPQYGSAGQNALDPDPLFSGTRTGITLEGPFLRYEIAAGAREWVAPDKIRIGGTNSSTDTLQFFFDIVGNRPILLPWPGKLSIITQYPGTWVFEYFTMESVVDDAMAILGADGMLTPSLDILSGNHPVRKASPMDADATLSLRLARPSNVAPASRVFAQVPLGAHSFVYNDGGTNPPTIAISQETVATIGKVTSFGSIPVDSLVLLSGPSSQAAFMTRAPHNNAVGGVSVQSGTNGVNGFMQWHTSLG